MTRQIEINFFVDATADQDQPPIASDLFGVSKDAAPNSMHLNIDQDKSKTASTSATVSENKDYLFKDQ